MFGRTKEPQAPVVVHLEKAGGKNRPTPRRTTAQAANRRPLVPSDRKGATAASRALTREDRQRAQQGRMAGEERYLPVRDRGPVKQYVRDLVDSRRNAGDWFMIFVLAILVLNYVLALAIKDARVLTTFTLVVYAALLVVVLDSWFLGRRVKRSVAERFGPEQTQGVTSYAVLRAVQMRRLRVPRPAVKPGQQPR